MTNATKHRYTPTTHAIDRARLRLGIDVTDATQWFNDMMRKAKYVITNDRGQAVYDKDGTRLVVDTRNKTIVTIYNEVKTDFLRPMLEREIRKLRRYYTPIIRDNELKHAYLLREIADMAVNRAKARNPHTRDIISGNIADKQAEADELLTIIERLNDEWKAKLTAIELISG